MTLQEQVSEWASHSIPERSSMSGLMKLAFEEIPELVRTVGSHGNIGDVDGELADCLILLLDVATLLGVDAEQAVKVKLAENASRQWVKNPETGFYNHVPF
jgi:NTP pyrophosphatase (non-canonical NTP hydrolase)